MIQKAAAYLTAMATILGAAWAGMTYALDSRYVEQEELTEAVEIIRRDRIKSDIRNAEMRLAVATMNAAYADGEWVERRNREAEIIRQEIESLERELEGVR